MESLWIEVAAGVRLRGVLHWPVETPRGGAVICHGMLSHKDSPKHVAIAEGLAARGHLALRFDFQGRGESPGDLLGLTFSREVEEARAAVALLRRRGIERIGIAGSSMGGAVAILLAADQELSGLVTMAAVGRAEALAERIAGPRGIEVWRRKGHLRLDGKPVGWALVEDSRRIDVLKAARQGRCPWLILHGGRDEVVPVADAEALHAARPSTLEVLPEADHQFSDPVLQASMTRRVVEFLADCLAR